MRLVGNCGVVRGWVLRVRVRACGGVTYKEANRKISQKEKKNTTTTKKNRQTQNKKTRPRPHLSKRHVPRNAVEKVFRPAQAEDCLAQDAPPPVARADDLVKGGQEDVAGRAGAAVVCGVAGATAGAAGGTPAAAAAGLVVGGGGDVSKVFGPVAVAVATATSSACLLGRRGGAGRVRTGTVAPVPIVPVRGTVHLGQDTARVPAGALGAGRAAPVIVVARGRRVGEGVGGEGERG